MGRRIEYNPPVQAGIRCRNCHGDIQAVAHLIGGLEVRGLHEYEWTHVDTGTANCPPVVRRAAPYDGWMATRLTEAALAAYQAANDAIDRALGIGPADEVGGRDA